MIRNVCILLLCSVEQLEGLVHDLFGFAEEVLQVERVQSLISIVVLFRRMSCGSTSTLITITQKHIQPVSDVRRQQMIRGLYTKQRSAQYSM